MSQVITNSHTLACYEPPEHGPQIIFSDQALIVAIKPSGLLCVPGRGAQFADCAISRIQRDFADARIVHRLDMATSGLLLLARGSACERALSIQFQQRLVDKHYIAWVTGLVEQDQGLIDAPLLTDWPNRPRQKIDFELGKSAQTVFEVTRRDPVRNITQLLLRPHTGRTHQLRVHLASIGHPICGDALYAEPSSKQEFNRLYLHASQLIFRHPSTQATMQFDSAPEFEWHKSSVAN